MFRARALATVLMAGLSSAVVLAAASWAGAESAARGVDGTKLPALLTLGNFAGLEWPFRVDQPPVVVHVTFYLAIALAAIVTGLVVAWVLRKASPRNGGAAFASSWLGLIIGSVLAAVLIYFMRVSALAPSLADRNGLLAGLLQDLSFGALLVGWLPALLAFATFVLVNRKQAAALAQAQAEAEGGPIDENPFDLSPGSISERRPVEPGFTYPSGDEFHDGSYRDADLTPAATDEPSRSEMTFSDPTDATGEDLTDRSDDYGIRRTPRTDPENVLPKTGT